MATQAQIDAAAAILVDALDLQDVNGVNVSQYNGQIVPKWNALAAAFTAGLPKLQAVGIDPTHAVALLNGLKNDALPTGAELRRISNAIAAMVPDDVTVDPPVVDPPASTAAFKVLSRFPAGSDNRYAIDYGGFTFNDVGEGFCIGGGHGTATAIPDLWRMAANAAVFVSDYKVPSYAEIAAAAGDATKISATGWLTLPGYQLMPVSMHAYSGNIWSHKIKRFLKLSPMAGATSGVGIDFITQSIGEYDPTTKQWTDTGVVPKWAGYAAYCEDPVSGNIITKYYGGFGVYDPVARQIVKWDNTQDGTITYDDCIVYYPPADTFFYIRHEGPVLKLRVDRSTWSHSLIDTGISCPPSVLGTRHFAYDPDSKLIVGGMDADTVYGIMPTGASKGVTKRGVPGAGTAQFHFWAYDKKNNRHVLVDRVGQVCEFRWNGSAPVVTPPVVDPPVVTPPNPDPTPAGPPVTVTGLIAARGVMNSSNVHDTGGPDYLHLPGDTAGGTRVTIGPPPAWAVYSDVATKTLSPSRNGVAPTLGWKKLHLCGNTPGLYGGIPRLRNGKFEFANPQSSDDVINGAIPNITNFPPTDGPRGACLVSPYTTWHSHTRIKADGTIGSDRAPLYLGIRADGMLCALMRDGSLKHMAKIPGAVGPLDYSTNPPNRLLLYTASTFSGQILLTDRTPGVSTGQPEDPSKYVTTVYCDGLGRPTSVRVLPNGDMYVCDNQANALLKVVDGVARKVLDIHAPFFVDYQSDGKLMVITSDTLVYRIDPAAPNLGEQLVPTEFQAVGQLNSNFWTVSVDRNGTIGPKDATYWISTHSGQNTNIFQIIGRTCVLNSWLPQGAGMNTVGNSQFCIDATGHYIWSAEPHEDEGLLLTQGFSNYLPALFRPTLPSDPVEAVFSTMGSQENKVLCDRGWTIWNTGCGSGQAYGSVPSFTAQADQYGWSNGFVTFDAIAELPFADQAKFMQQGMLGIHKRPSLVGYDLLCVLMRINWNSQQHLLKGAAHIDALKAFIGSVTPTAGTEWPIELYKDYFVTPTDLGDKIRLEVWTAKDGIRNPAPDADLMVRVVVDQFTTNERELGVFPALSVVNKLPGDHTYRALPSKPVASDGGRYYGRTLLP